MGRGFRRIIALSSSQCLCQYYQDPETDPTTVLIRCPHGGNANIVDEKKLNPLMVFLPEADRITELIPERTKNYEEELCDDLKQPMESARGSLSMVVIEGVK